MITNNIASVAGGSCEQPILGGGGTIVFHRDLRGNSRVGKPRVKFPSAAHQSPLPRLLNRSPRGFIAHLHYFATKTEALAREIPPAMQTTNNRIQHLNGGRSNLKKKKGQEQKKTFSQTATLSPSDF